MNGDGLGSRGKHQHGFCSAHLEGFKVYLHFSHFLLACAEIFMSTAGLHRNVTTIHIVWIISFFLFPFLFLSAAEFGWFHRPRSWGNVSMQVDEIFSESARCVMKPCLLPLLRSSAPPQANRSCMMLLLLRAGLSPSKNRHDSGTQNKGSLSKAGLLCELSCSGEAKKILRCGSCRKVLVRPNSKGGGKQYLKSIIRVIII